MEQICISSFINNGHKYILYAYDNIKNLPEGTIIKDANDIIDKSRVFKYKHHDSYAGFSNMFRYKLLYEKGGYWVDTDIFCLKPFALKNNYIFASQRSKKDGVKKVNCCLMKAPAKSKIMEFCYQESKMKHPDMLKWGDTGPNLLTKAVIKFGMWDNVLSPEVFCPIDWWDWKYFITESNMNIFTNSLSIHLWNEMWRRNKVDKSIKHQKNCVYENLKSMVQ